jgi:23S rRNA (guanosine2251-2'-O)-methyltransferase
MSEESTIFGIHAVKTLLERSPQRVLALVLQKARDDARMREIKTLAASLGVKIESRDARELDQLSGGQQHQGICARIRATQALGEGALDDLLDGLKRPPFLLVLDGVQDPHNLGACMRTAEGAGVDAVVVPRDRAVGLTPTVRKVASGAAEIVPFIQVVNLARTLGMLKEREVWVVGTDEEGTSLHYEANLVGSLAIVMGAEGDGMRRLTKESCDALVRIPMLGATPSLNVSVATGILLFEAVRQRGKPRK